MAVFKPFFKNILNEDAHEISMPRKQMRSRTKKFLSVAGLASIVLGTPSMLQALLKLDMNALLLPTLFVIGGCLLIGMVVYEQVPKKQRKRKRKFF